MYAPSSHPPSLHLTPPLASDSGPKAARKYAEARDAALSSNKVHALPEFDAKADAKAATVAEKAAVHGGQQVLVLTEGFGGFGPKYKVSWCCVDALHVQLSADCLICTG